ncbi:MAG: ATP-binding protein [Synergistales bacterium]|nr:ATP-binding protein [Synergistales bacterium]
MSFYADKKREHEALATKAAQKKDFAKAFFHTAKAADYGFSLAEVSEGKLARAYLEDAKGLLEIAEKLKEKAREKKAETPPVDSADPVQIKEESKDKDHSPSPWRITEKPEIKLQDVAGLEDVKKALQEDVINVYSHPEVYERFKVQGGGGVLMYGPPGNGKTFIAKAIAGELDAAFFSVSASQIKDKYVGETEKNMSRLFREAREQERAVIFFDEIDALLQKRGNQKVNAVAEFLILADGVAAIKGGMLLLLGATNKPWSIDPAVLRPGRFGKHIYVGLPDLPAREAIIKYSLKEIPLDPAFSFHDMAEKTEGYSGADIANLCSQAKKAAIRRQLDTGEEQYVGMGDFEVEMTRIQPSVTQSQLEEFEAWKQERKSFDEG